MLNLGLIEHRGIDLAGSVVRYRLSPIVRIPFLGADSVGGGTFWRRGRLRLRRRRGRTHCHWHCAAISSGRRRRRGRVRRRVPCAIIAGQRRSRVPGASVEPEAGRGRARLRLRVAGRSRGRFHCSRSRLSVQELNLRKRGCYSLFLVLIPRERREGEQRREGGKEGKET